MSPVASRRMSSPATRSAVAPVGISPPRNTVGPVVALRQPVERPARAAVGELRARAAGPRRPPGRAPITAPAWRTTLYSGVGACPCRRCRGTASCRRRAGCATNQSTAACAERAQLRGGHGRAALGRRGHAEDDDRAATASVAPARRTRVSAVTRLAPAGRPAAAGVGRANQAVSGSRLSANASGGPAADRGAVAVHDLERATPAAPARRGSAPASRARAPRAANGARRIDAEHPVARGRHRPDQRAPRCRGTEKTCTDADASIVRWKIAATHTAA